MITKLLQRICFGKPTEGEMLSSITTTHTVHPDPKETLPLNSWYNYINSALYTS